MSSGLLRSNLIVAAGTALSRVSGLARTFTVAYVLGGSLVADAYLTANETPNIVYDLLLGGVLSATLVPLFTSYLEPEIGNHDPTEYASTSTDRHRATNVIITTAVTALVALTVVAVLAAPFIFALYSQNVPDGVDADLYREAGTALTRIFLLQIFLYGLTGLANAYLNSRKRFFAAAWSPVASNIIIVITLLSLPGPGDTVWTLADVISNDRLRWTLGLGATGGIAAMAAIVVPAMASAGLKFRPVFDFGHPVVKKLFVLSGWTIGFVAANQVALVVVRNLALGLGEGLASAYFYAFTFFVLPHGLLAVSVATTFQPELARSVTGGDRHRFLDQIGLGVRSIGVLTFPAAAALVALAEPISGLMTRGRFGPIALDNTADALAGLAIGLPAFSIYLFTLRGFYAHQDTRTPFILNVGENLINIVLAVVLVQWLGIFGLGLSFALAYVAAAVWALVVLGNKVPGLPLVSLRASLWRVGLAAVLAAEAMWFVTHAVSGVTKLVEITTTVGGVESTTTAVVDGSNAGWYGVAKLVVGGAVGIAVYIAALVALESPELRSVTALLKRRIGRDADLRGASRPAQPS